MEEERVDDDDCSLDVNSSVVTSGPMESVDESDCVPDVSIDV